KRMGIFDIMREKSSQEEGVKFVDGKNRAYAEFGVDASGEGDSMTCDIEILRGELAKILFDVTKDDVEYIFGDVVERLEETEKEIVVGFAKGTPERAFDLVVGADGIGSSIRGMVFGRDELSVRSLNAYISYFSIPKTDIDTLWSRVHWIKGGRNMVMRPDNMGRTRAFLSLIAYSKSDERLAQLDKAAREGIPEQKAVVQELFQDGDWEMQRILKGMHESDDFYMQYIGQVRLDRWSSGRVTVVGDAGYAASPFSGMGTSLAFLGAYVLAGEISRQPNNIPAALKSYERVLRPHVESIQNLPPGIPWIVNPQSALGVKVLNTFLWGFGLLSKIGVVTLVSKIAAYLPVGGKPFKLPEYEAFRE
ncbi:Uncharacterized protein LCER1_G008459, partial [Lachnellula cervina]